MKNKKIILIIVLVIIILTVSGIILIKYNNKNNNSNDDNEKTNINEKNEESKSEKKEEYTINFSNEEIEKIDSKIEEMHNKLNEYGEIIYKTKDYLNFDKKDEIYFASLKTINEKYNYDISMFVGSDGTICNIDESGIFFDVEHKLSKETSKDKNDVITMLIGCSKNEIKD